MFITAIEDAFLTILNDYFNTPIILDYQSGPEPTGDYGVLGISTFNKVHRNTNNFYKTDTGFEERIKQDYEITLTVKFYGNSCYDNAFEAQASLQMIDTQDQLFTFNCISSPEITSIRRIPELRDTGYIQKASFDVTFLTAFEQVREVDWFDTVEYSGEYIDQADNVVLTEENTVSANDPSPFN